MPFFKNHLWKLYKKGIPAGGSADKILHYHQMEGILSPYLTWLTVRGLVQLERITFRAVLYFV